jgi:hypothetical protein
VKSVKVGEGGGTCSYDNTASRSAAAKSNARAGAAATVCTQLAQHTHTKQCIRCFSQGSIARPYNSTGVPIGSLTFIGFQ